MDILDSQEWAYLSWIILILLIMLISKSTRGSFFAILSILFARKLMSIYLLAALYILSGVFYLYKLNFWDFSLLKETVLWLILVGYVMLYKTVSVKNVKSHFIETVNDTFKWTIGVEFIIGLYTLDVLIEFFIVPIVFLAGVAIFLTESKEQYKKLNIILKKVLIGGSALLLLYKIGTVLSDVDRFINTESLKEDFILPVFLTILFLPFLYAFYLFVNYGLVYQTLTFSVKNPRIHNYAKMQALYRFNFNVNALRRWKDSLFVNEVMSEADILNSIREIRKLHHVEKNPPHIDSLIGWSPYNIKDILNVNGLATHHYHRVDGINWMAGSEYLILQGSPANNIAYYIEGTEEVANSLKLVLNVNDMSFKDEAYNVLLSNAKVLYKKILYTELCSQLEKVILNGTDYISIKDLIEVTIKRVDWQTQKRSHHVIFELRHTFNPADIIS